MRICTRLGIPVLRVNNCTNGERLLFGLSVCCRRSGTDIGGCTRARCPPFDLLQKSPSPPSLSLSFRISFSLQLVEAKSIRLSEFFACISFTYYFIYLRYHCVIISTGCSFNIILHAYICASERISPQAVKFIIHLCGMNFTTEIIKPRMKSIFCN